MKLLSNIIIVLLALSASTDAKPASPEVKPHGDPPAGGISSKDAKQRKFFSLQSILEDGFRDALQEALR